MRESSIRDQFSSGGESFGSNMMGAGTLQIGINMPYAKQSREGAGGEFAHSLPPYAERAVFRVNDFPGAIEAFGEDDGSGATRFFTPLVPGQGLWFDLTQLARDSHHVAAVINVQGVNAITGLPVDRSNVVLMQHKEKCPKDGTPFTDADLFCPVCGFNWPAQNYLSTRAANGRPLWLDGWRQPDGEVRQFVTDEHGAAGGVAQAIVGDERFFGFEFTLYRTLERKPEPAYRTRGGAATLGGDMLESFSMGAPTRSARRGVTRSASKGIDLGRDDLMEVSAGAKIKQLVYPDGSPVTDYSGEIAARYKLVYCSVDTALEILRAGRGKAGEGFLGDAGVPTGNWAGESPHQTS